MMIGKFGICLFVVTTLTAVVGPIARAAESVTLEVSAGDHERLNVPVFFELTEALRTCRRFRLERMETDAQKPVPVQCEEADRPRVVWLIRDKLPAGATRRYRLTAAAERPASGPGAVRCTDDGQCLQLMVGDRPVLGYNHTMVQAADRSEACYDRSGFIHPVRSPSGRVLTDNLAPDHKHQHGIMYPWRVCSFEGHMVDFWHEKLRVGKVEHGKMEATGGGDVFAYFTARLRHVDLTGAGKRKPVLDETWRVRVYNLTDCFVFDLESVQTCATGSPLIVKKFAYGGMAIRGSRRWSKPDLFDFLTSEGKTRKDGNHTRPRWCAMHGVLDGQPAGLTTLCHPGNLRFPQHVRLHPTMPYYCWAPMVEGDFRIEPGKPFVSKYRFIAFDGKVDAAVAERHWQDYAHPVQVRIVEGP